jgi:hypothetical protein
MDELPPFRPKDFTHAHFQGSCRSPGYRQVYEINAGYEENDEGNAAEDENGAEIKSAGYKGVQMNTAQRLQRKGEHWAAGLPPLPLTRLFYCGSKILIREIRELPHNSTG